MSSSLRQRPASRAATAEAAAAVPQASISPFSLSQTRWRRVTPFTMRTKSMKVFSGKRPVSSRDWPMASMSRSSVLSAKITQCGLPTLT